MKNNKRKDKVLTLALSSASDLSSSFSDKKNNSDNNSLNDKNNKSESVDLRQGQNSKIFEVLPVGPFDNAFLYLYDSELVFGDVVEIPFGRRSILGLVLGKIDETDRELKYISKSYGINIGKNYCDFLNWVASYTLIPRGNLLKMILCEKTVFSVKKTEETSTVKAEEKNQNHFNPILLNSEQEEVRKKIIENGNHTFLLQGVTGSGKTEVYLSVIQECLRKNSQALIMLPEIALTTQLSDRIEKYFNQKAIIWNSNITPKSRRLIWKKAISGEKCVIIGTRSALFLPFKDLGIIIVDEEHDSSYKQEDMGFYNARDMAVVLGDIKKIPVILSSATPSMESYINAKNGKYGYAHIKSRFGTAKEVSIELIDMRQCKFEDNFVSLNLFNAISETIEKKEQVLIYLNRRGYSPITLCKKCGKKLACPNCTSWLVYHKNINKVVCHYCDYKITIPKKCDNCGVEDSYIQFGPGVERIYEELSRRIPAAKIQLFSSDNIVDEKSIIELREKILKNEVDIIIGTQILAKGHHFPNITLVGVVDGDLGLSNADLRAAERTYQLIQQVGGRAGRSEKPGKILIQTFNPEHSLYTALKSNNIQKFIDLEISSREKNELPPFGKLASIIISGNNKEFTEKTARNVAESLHQYISFNKNKISIFGPAPAPLFLLRGRTRWRILLRSSKKIAINKVIKSWFLSQKLPKNVKIQIDIDPITFL